jgi:hypothetical protein
VHLDDERVERLIHGELSPEAEREARAHVDTCAACAERARESEREERSVLALLGALDHPVPVVRPADVMPTRRRAPARLARLAAAVLVAVSVAGVAYAAPGSPLPRLVRRAMTWAAPAQRVAAPAPEATAPAQAYTAGVAVEPGERFRIEFASVQDSGQILVTLSDEPEVVVRARHAGASFATKSDRVTIANAGSAGSYDVVIPRAAPYVAIDVAGQERLVVVRGRARGSGESSWVLPLSTRRAGELRNQ